MIPRDRSEHHARYPAGHVLAGRFRIVRLLGGGGMGEVYEAADLVLNQHIAIKLVRPESRTDPRMLSLLRDEVRKARSVSHPNVCRVFDLEQDEVEGVVFVTMELLRGETLEAILRRRKCFTPAEALPVLRQIAGGMDAIHACRVLHLDFKPGNVMLDSRDGEAPRAVVTDFGLAQSHAPADSAESTHSMVEYKGGTPRYMAPERFSSVGRFTPAADVYAFGLVAMEMLAGSHAVRIPGAPIPLLREAAPDAPPRWETVFRRCLAPKPEDRYPTCGAAVEALDGAAGRSRFVPAWTRARRRTVLLAAAAITLAAAAWILRPTPPSASAAALRWFNQGMDAIGEGTYYKAVLSLDQAIKESPGFAMAHAGLAEAWSELDSPERAAEEMLRISGPEGAASHLPSSRDRDYIQAILHTVNRDYGKAVADYEHLTQSVSATERPRALVDLGRALERANEPRKAADQYEVAIRLDPNYAGAYLRLAILAGKGQKSDKMAQALDRAQSLFEASSNLDGATEVFYQRGVYANNRAQLDEAQRWLERARQSALVTRNPYRQIGALLQLSAVAYQRVDTSNAQKLAEDAIREARANNIEFLAGRGFLDLGNSFLTRGDSGRATEYFNEALRIARNYHRGQLEAMALYSLGSIGIRDRKDEAGARQMEQALAWFQANSYPAESSKCLLFLGQFRRDRGDLSAAAEAFQQQLELAQASKNELQRGLALTFIASVLLRQERFLQALGPALDSLAASKRLGDSLRAGWAQERLARVYAELGSFDQAVRAAQEAEAIAKKGNLDDLLADALATRAHTAFLAGASAEAAGMADRGMTAYQKRYPQLVGELLGILALVRRNAPARTRLDWSTRGVELVQGDAGASLSARLTEAQVRLETRDPSGTLEICRQIRPIIERQQSDYSLFRVDLITALALRQSGQDASGAVLTAEGALQRFQKQFDAPAWERFRSRADFRDWEKIFRQLKISRL